jgi:hypothetical protein
MQRWRSPAKLALPIPFDTVKRIDLEFINVRRDAGSFTAFVFLSAGGEVPKDAGPDDEHFAGSFSIFAPSECWGGEGHCDWDRGPASPFDKRPQHHLAPINVSLEVTKTAFRLGDPKKLDVTVHASRTADPKASKGVLGFDELTMLAYA